MPQLISRWPCLWSKVGSDVQRPSRRSQPRWTDAATMRRLFRLHEAAGDSQPEPFEARFELDLVRIGRRVLAVPPVCVDTLAEGLFEGVRIELGRRPALHAVALTLPCCRHPDHGRIATPHQNCCRYTR